MESDVDRRRENPYVGPRPFGAGPRDRERFFGRTAEVQELDDLLVAERVVLLHSPSGAGKTSLIQAALIPQMEKEKFRVPPVIGGGDDSDAPETRALIRFARPWPALPEGTSPPNRYLFSMLLSLEEWLPTEDRLAPGDLAALDLDAYLQRRAEPSHQNDASEGPRPAQELWVFDQFEELLTLDDHDRTAKEQFCEALGRVLRRDKSRWVLFAIREEFLGGLAPYVHTIPSRLKTTYRLDLLGVEAASEAIREPAARRGVTFRDDAIAALVGDLLGLGRPLSEADAEMDLHVDPVQLQVVCRWIWDRLPPGATEIDADAIRAVGLAQKEKGEATDATTPATFGAVERALAGYYDECVRDVARRASGAGPGDDDDATAPSASFAAEASERRIREWFAYRLISEKNTRLPVVLNDGEAGGLPAGMLADLGKTYLIHKEAGPSFSWVELAHDRLIGPIRQSNDAWSREHLSPLQRLASRWSGQGRSDKLLASHRGLSELVDYAIWAARHPDRMTEVDREFLDRSRGALSAIGKFQYSLIAHRRAIGALAGVAAVLLVAWLLVSLYRHNATISSEFKTLNGQMETLSGRMEKVDTAWKTTKSALNKATTFNSNQGLGLRESQRRLQARALAARAISFQSDQPDLALLLSIEAVRVAAATATPNNPTAYPSGFPADSSASALDAQARGSLLGALLNTPELTTYRRGHEESVLGIAARDGIVTSLDSDGVLISEKTSGQAVGRVSLEINDAPIAAFSPDRQRLATAAPSSADGPWKVTLWSPADAHPLRAISPPGSSITAMAFSPDHKLLATAALVRRERSSPTAEVRLWDVTTGEEPSPAIPFSAPVGALAFDPKGAMMAVGTAVASEQGEAIGSAYLWDLEHHERRGPSLPHSAPVTALAFGAEGRVLAVGCGDSAAAGLDADSTVIWDTGKGQRIGMPLLGHQAAVSALAFTADGSTLVSGGRDNAVYLWDLQAEREAGEREGKGVRDDRRGGRIPINARTGRSLARRLNGHKGPVTGVALDGSTLATTSVDKTVILWDIDRRRRLARPLRSDGDGQTWGVASGGDSTALVVGDRDGAVRIFEAPFKESKGQERRGKGPLSGLALDPDGSAVVIGNEGGPIEFWDLASNKGREIPSSALGVPNALSFNPGGEILAWLDRSRLLRLWDVKAAKPIPTPQDVASRRFRSLAFGHDGLLALGNDDGRVRLVLLDPPGIVAHRDCHAGAVQVLAFSPDGKTLASGGADNAVYLWDVSTKDGAGAALTLHKGAVRALAFSPDGRTLASGGADRAVILWDVRARLPLGPPMAGHDDGVTSLAYLDRGRALASADRGGAALLWDVDLDSWRNRACEIARRDLTREEWTMFVGDEAYRPTCGAIGNVGVAMAPAQPPPTGLPPVPPLHRGPGILLDKRWAPGQVLRVGFLDGDEASQAIVRDAAAEWSLYANIRFEFGDPKGAEIRVSFREPYSSYSFLGKDCLTVPPDQPTTALGIVAGPVPENVKRRSALHELGHALGLIHEHQKPDADIAWDREKLFKLAQEQYGWTADMVQATYLTRFPREEVGLNPRLDPTSIMVFPIPKEYTTDGRGMEMNDDLSESDKAGIRAAYPPQTRTAIPRERATAR